MADVAASLVPWYQSSPETTAFKTYPVGVDDDFFNLLLMSDLQPTGFMVVDILNFSKFKKDAF
jgi:hypothetical protein